MKRNHPEDDLATAVASFLNVAAPDLIWWHTANEATLPKRKNKSGKWFSPEGVRRKAMGVRSGVADLQFLLGNGKTAFIELKVGSRTQSDTQEDFEEDVTALGCPYVVCRSIDDVRVTLEDWGVVLRGRIVA